MLYRLGRCSTVVAHIGGGVCAYTIGRVIQHCHDLYAYNPIILQRKVPLQSFYCIPCSTAINTIDFAHIIPTGGKCLLHIGYSFALRDRVVFEIFCPSTDLFKRYAIIGTTQFDGFVFQKSKRIFANNTIFFDLTRSLKSLYGITCATAIDAIFTATMKKALI